MTTWAGSFSLPEYVWGADLKVGDVITLKFPPEAAWTDGEALDGPVRCIVIHVGPPVAGFVTYDLQVDLEDQK